MPQTSLIKEQRREIEVEESLEQLSRYMDGLFRVPVVGWRFGLDSLVGLVPGLGDTATTVVSFYILAAAVRYRVPKITILRMALNIAVDYIVGSIPFAGDAFDFVWKSNQKNMDLLRTRATVSKVDARGARFGDWLFVAGVMLFLLLVLGVSLLITVFLLGAIWQALAAAFNF